MRRAPLFSTLMLLLLVTATGQLHAGNKAGMLYVESGSAGHGLSRERLESCLRSLTREMGIGDKSLPSIVVIHISAHEGERAGLKKVSIKLRVNYDAEQANPYYELWLVGEPSTFDYTYSLEVLLEQHFQLHLGDEERQTIARRVARYLDATVSTREMRAGVDPR